MKQNPKQQYHSDAPQNRDSLYSGAVNSPLRFQRAIADDNDDDSADASDDDSGDSDTE